jgi:hypothetical protein
VCPVDKPERFGNFVEQHACRDPPFNQQTPDALRARRRSDNRGGQMFVHELPSADGQDTAQLASALVFQRTEVEDQTPWVGESDVGVGHRLHVQGIGDSIGVSAIFTVKADDERLEQFIGRELRKKRLMRKVRRGGEFNGLEHRFGMRIGVGATGYPNILGECSGARIVNFVMRVLVRRFGALRSASDTSPQRNEVVHVH